MGSMTIDTICQTIRQALEMEAAKEGGPDVEPRCLVLQGFVEEDPALKAVLLAKGTLTIEIKPLWPVQTDASLKDNMDRARALAGVEVPAGMVARG